MNIYRRRKTIDQIVESWRNNRWVSKGKVSATSVDWPHARL